MSDHLDLDPNSSMIILNIYFIIIHIEGITKSKVP